IAASRGRITLPGPSSHGARWLGASRVGQDGEEPGSPVLHPDGPGHKAAHARRRKLEAAHRGCGTRDRLRLAGSVMAWFQKLRNIFRPGRLQNELERELAFHVREREEELRESGLSQAEAARAARQQFGNFT